MLNANLGRADFYKLRKCDQAGFKRYRIETIPRGTALYKLTRGTAPEDPQWGLSPWWSAMRPFKEDLDGAIGRFNQAKDRNMDMSSWGRYMSAVVMEFNSLDNYVQVSLKDDTKAFWGPFAPMPKWEKGEWVKASWGWMADMNYFKRKEAAAKALNGAQLPDQLGVEEAWQFYIPNLKEADIAREGVIDAHNMAALEMAFCPR